MMDDVARQLRLRYFSTHFGEGAQELVLWHRYNALACQFAEEALQSMVVCRDTLVSRGFSERKIAQLMGLPKTSLRRRYQDSLDDHHTSVDHRVSVIDVSSIEELSAYKSSIVDIDVRVGSITPILSLVTKILEEMSKGLIDTEREDFANGYEKIIDSYDAWVSSQLTLVSAYLSIDTEYDLSHVMRFTANLFDNVGVFRRDELRDWGLSLQTAYGDCVRTHGLSYYDDVVKASDLFTPLNEMFLNRLSQMRSLSIAMYGEDFTASGAFS